MVWDGIGLRVEVELGVVEVDAPGVLTPKVVLATLDS